MRRISKEDCKAYMEVSYKKISRMNITYEWEYTKRLERTS